MPAPTRRLNRSPSSRQAVRHRETTMGLPNYHACTSRVRWRILPLREEWPRYLRVETFRLLWIAPVVATPSNFRLGQPIPACSRYLPRTATIVIGLFYGPAHRIRLYPKKETALQPVMGGYRHHR